MSHVNVNFASPFRNHKSGSVALTDEQIMRTAPSVFASAAHESRSDRYTYIPTSDVLTGLRAEGFLPVFAAQGRSRVPGKAEFTKHMLRFRHAADLATVTTQRAAPEILLINSHDGTTTYRVMSGQFRFACLNGLIVCEEERGNLRVPHKGDIVRNVIDASYTIVDDAREQLRLTSEWRGIDLTHDERRIFAEAVHQLRFDEESALAEAIPARALLTVRRREDAGTDLDTTMNVVQENVIRGGMSGIARDANNRRRNVTTRPVNGIDQNVRLNMAVSHLAREMAKLKGAA